MAASIDDSGFWLPTHFPYEVDSNEDETTDDDDFIAGLTRRLAQRLSVPCSGSETIEKQRVSAGSPQSTLTGVGSPNGTSQVSSPPTTPFRGGDKTWEVIYAAAGQVARLRIGGGADLYCNNQNRVPNNNSVLYSSQFHQFARREREVKVQNRAPYGVRENRGFGCPANLSHSTWPPLRRHHHNQPPRAPATKPELIPRAGTGVFIPRAQINAPDFRKKGGCSQVLVPAKVVQALNLSFGNGNGNYPPRAGTPHYEAVMGRRSTRSVPESRRSHEAVTLPQEWTY